MLRRALNLLLSLALCAFAAHGQGLASARADQREALLSGARLWISKKEPERAQQMLDRALLLQPGDPEALALKGELELKAKRTQQALRWLEQLKQHAPADPFTHELADTYRIATVDRQRMARAQLLARAGKHEEALQLLRELFPGTAPTGDLGIDFYRILAASPKQRMRAVTGLEKLAAAAPRNMDYQLALAGLLVDEPATREHGIRLAMALYHHPAVNRDQARELWRRGLLSAGKQPEHLAALDAYLVEDPQDASLRDLRQAVADEVEAHRKLEADPAWQAGQHGLRLMSAGQLEAAEADLRQALKSRPNDAELVGGLGLIRLRQGRHGEAEQWFAKAAALDAEGRKKWLGLIATARLWGGIAEARAALAAGHVEVAADKLRALGGEAPRQPELWVLAGDVNAAGKRWAQAEQAYRTALDSAYSANALEGWVGVLNQSGRSGQVSGVLARYRTRYPAAAGEIDRLSGRQLSDDGDRLAAAGRRGPAVAKYEQALPLLADDPWLRFRLAGLYRDLGVPEFGRSVMADGVAHLDNPTMRYAAALYASSLDDNDGALALLQPLADKERDPTIRQLEQRLKVRRAVLLATQAQRQGKREDSARLLDEAAALAGDDGELRADVAQAYVSADRPEPGLKLLDDWLVFHQGRDILPLRLRYAGLLAQARRDEALAKDLAELAQERGLSAEQHQRVDELGFEMTLRRADGLQARNLLAEAEQTLLPLAPRWGSDARYKMARGELARAGSDYAAAAGWYRAAMPFDAAAQALDGLEARRQPMLAGAYDIAGKSGDDGISRLRAVETPLYGQVPLGYAGHLFAHADHVDLDAGSVDLGLPSTAADYGTIAATGAVNNGRVVAANGAPLAGTTRQRAGGETFAVGYSNDDWRFDLGHTPLSFPVNYWVGGVRWQKSIGGVFYSVDLSRRPQTSSLLSYAGGRDPITGTVWGGVRNTSVSLHAGWDVGRLSLSSTMTLARLTGDGVESNRAFTFRQAFDWAVLERPDQRVTLGLTANYWNYAHDLSGYTLGNGGYYSPQSYLSLGVPLEWSGRAGKLAYRLDATLGVSRSRTAEADYFPTRPDLQQQALANADTFGRPVNDASSGGGIGYGASAALEYSLTPNWLVGGLIGIDRSKDYAPNRAQLYFRYNFKAQRGPVDYPPSPVRPYSRY
jgi:predicted Zn-dependent protease